MSSRQIVWLSPADSADAFPDIDNALCEPDGLLAAGGDLSSDRLVAAYAKGIFPWFDDGQPILWWSPDPRCVLRPADYHVSRRLLQTLRSSALTVSINRAFSDVIRECAGDRRPQQGTWITQDMIAAYQRLHEEGWAHSVEVWNSDRLAGGMYGLAIGKVFFGESMFSAESNTSKVALLGLCRQLVEHDFALLDCQVVSQHLMTLGATTIPRPEFAQILSESCIQPVRFDQWTKKTMKIRDLLPT